MSTNNRASFLANLRTGGVRSSTNPLPQTAAPTVTSFPRQELPMSPPLNASFNPIFPAQTHAQAQAQLQMQMMQAEIMRLQAIQQMQQMQQYQLELARQQQQVTNRRNSTYVEPVTADPIATSFIRSRTSQAEHLKAQLHLDAKSCAEEQVPMTAALGGKFGGRLNPNATTFRFGRSFDDEEREVSPPRTTRQGSSPPNNTPVSPNYTTVISGGTPLGMANGSTSGNSGSGMSPSKSDTVVSWRRGSNVNTALNGNRAPLVNVKITPPPVERSSPSPDSAHPVKARPQPLRFSVTMHDTVPAVSVDTSDSDATEDADDTSSNSSNSLPTTPPTGGSTGASYVPPLSPREEASKRLYEGLGLGRPVPQSASVHTMSFPGASTASIPAPYTSAGTTFGNKASMSVLSQPMRQPRGPPSGVEELGPKNFASRIRRKAIGGLGAMLDARVNRREIEAF